MDILARAHAMEDMAARLKEAEAILPTLLTDGQPWNSVLVDYHPPIVERLWRQQGLYRISLHRIHPCKPGEALFHPHPWPSAMRLLDGRYEMIVGFRPYDENRIVQEPPPVAAKFTLGAYGLHTQVYEMSNPGSWHAVRPLDQPSLSVMVSGQPLWKYPEGAHKEFKPLGKAKANKLLARFRSHYMTPEAQEIARSRAGYGHEHYD